MTDIERMAELAKELRTQDRRATNEPQYMVLFEDTVLTTCLTLKAAEAFAKARNHDYYDKLYVRVESGWRNEEWIFLRKFIMDKY